MLKKSLPIHETSQCENRCKIFWVMQIQPPSAVSLTSHMISIPGDTECTPNLTIFKMQSWQYRAPSGITDKEGSKQDK